MLPDQPFIPIQLLPKNTQTNSAYGYPVGIVQQRTLIPPRLQHQTPHPSLPAQVPKDWRVLYNSFAANRDP